MDTTMRESARESKRYGDNGIYDALRALSPDAADLLCRSVDAEALGHMSSSEATTALHQMKEGTGADYLRVILPVNDYAGLRQACVALTAAYRSRNGTSQACPEVSCVPGPDGYSR